ncbi:MAG: MotA/TolQ/ExbB proton channel family protein [Bacteroidota bacterium]
MEKGIMIGLGVGLVLILIPVVTGGAGATFLDVPSMLLVIGGTLAALLVAFSLTELKQVVPGFKAFVGFQDPSLDEYVDQFGELARMARRDGVLALDRKIDEIEDPVMKMGLEMIVDGVDEEEVSDLMQVKIKQELGSMSLMANFFNTAGTYAPSFGMIGTLIGLITMLNDLSDPSQIGAGMAVAMVTTFYGAVVANLFFLPFAGKASGQLSTVRKSRQIVLTGILSIVRGESPTMIEKRLRLFIGEQEDDGAGVEDARAAA